MQLDEMLTKQGTKIDKVLNFAIDDAILEERITGRWIHPPSGRTYHTKYAPPKVLGIDDVSRWNKFIVLLKHVLFMLCKMFLSQVHVCCVATVGHFFYCICISYLQKTSCGLVGLENFALEPSCLSSSKSWVNAK